MYLTHCCFCAVHLFLLATSDDKTHLPTLPSLCLRTCVTEQICLEPTLALRSCFSHAFTCSPFLFALHFALPPHLLFSFPRHVHHGIFGHRCDSYGYRIQHVTTGCLLRRHPHRSLAASLPCCFILLPSPPCPKLKPKQLSHHK